MLAASEYLVFAVEVFARFQAKRYFKRTKTRKVGFFSVVGTDTHRVEERLGGVVRFTPRTSHFRCLRDVTCSHAFFSWTGGDRWAFLCTNEGILAWEQGMVSAERTGAAVGADQACVRLDHPTMMEELANMEPAGGEREGERVSAAGFKGSKVAADLWWSVVVCCENLARLFCYPASSPFPCSLGFILSFSSRTHGATALAIVRADCCFFP